MSVGFIPDAPTPAVTFARRSVSVAPLASTAMLESLGVTASLLTNAISTKVPAALIVNAGLLSGD